METLALPEDEQPAADDGSAKKPAKKEKRQKVPNFNKFRMRLFLGVLLFVAVIAGLYYCAVVLPKATVAISTKTSTVNVNLTASLDPSAQTLDTTKSVIPAKIEQQQKTTTQQVSATGQKNTGSSANGTVTMTAVKCGGNPFAKLPTVPGGAAVSSNGLTYITQTDTSFTTSGATTDSNGCYNYPAAGSTAIVAQGAGTKYNTSFTAAAVSGVISKDTTATGTSAVASGSASGGTDNIIHIVSQADIDGAKQKLAAADNSAEKDTLSQTLRQDGRYPLPVTFTAGAPIITSSNNAGDQADTVTVTQAITYTMYGVDQSSLEALIKAKVNSSVDTRGQSIVNDGLSSATVVVVNTANSVDNVTLQTVAVIGPNINALAVKNQIAGKKAGDAKTILTGLPGVTQVDVRLSPFWVSAVPGNPKKVTVTISGVKQT